MKVKGESEIVQSCPTLRDPMDCSLPGSSVHGIFQARVLECVPLPSPSVFYLNILSKVDIFKFLESESESQSLSVVSDSL